MDSGVSYKTVRRGGGESAQSGVTGIQTQQKVSRKRETERVVSRGG